MYSKTVMVGRLTKDPELKYTGDGKPLAKFSIAVDRDYKKQDGSKQTDFFNVTAWGKTAEVCAKYLKKGALTLLDGRMETRKFENNNTGQMVTVTELNCEKMQMLGGKNEGGGNGQQAQQKPLKEEDDPTWGAADNVDYDDIPF